MNDQINDVGDVMKVERERLLSLIEFSQQSALLRGKPAATVAVHGLFSLYEHELQGLPGIRLNINYRDSEDEIWLAVERLHETKPPEVVSSILRPWVHMTQAPTEEPRLINAVYGATLIATGTHCSSREPPEDGKPAVDPELRVALSDYENASLVQAQFATYLATMWRPWAEEEKRRRRTIRLYSQLFTLKHQFEGSIVETQLELVWGVGVGIWNSNGTTVSYPLIGQLVELTPGGVDGNAKRAGTSRPFVFVALTSYYCCGRRLFPWVHGKPCFYKLSDPVSGIFPDILVNSFSVRDTHGDTRSPCHNQHWRYLGRFIRPWDELTNLDPSEKSNRVRARLFGTITPDDDG